MRQYLDLMQKVLDTGVEQMDRSASISPRASRY
jgi:hypothetical protein